MVDQILFYEPDEPHGFLSNFCHAPVEISSQSWPTSEHYYQAQKFVDAQLQTKIQKAQSPDEAFALSRQYEHLIRSDWDNMKLSVMAFIVREKFLQNPKLAQKLMRTGNACLTEHSHKDAFWGDGGDGKGLNHLGEILMNVRAELRHVEPYNLVKFIDKAKLPTQWGTFMMHCFIETATGKEHLALVYGDPTSQPAPLIRLHSECLTGDALFSTRCDCGFQLNRALQNIVEEGCGVLLYLRQEGRGIGLINKIRAYHLQDDGADTVEANERLGFAADMRDYAFCKGMLEHLGIDEVRLMTNNPRKLAALKNAHINVVERVPLQEGRNPSNQHYLKTKANKLGHMFDPHFVDQTE
ncbi:TPA: GTP cyclohydrolase II [Vibrio parahaemolyticus]|nr:GTP cyclohydrolase II [Vibrio parahaemolyticus]EIW7482986.1 GTP cyclohydrolase II [Vibrio parahaemolyticus]EKZ9249533.1 GTP cyclohydrolase II [Vibrio parahaemolyticus]EKZ9252099.1 GTP cyclohydrolase II [Vibrio parahaemolyticus]ELA6677978.1 GTP cyclohydrolase II [Vibrio parahaemolyticus]